MGIHDDGEGAFASTCVDDGAADVAGGVLATIWSRILVKALRMFRRCCCICSLNNVSCSVLLVLSWVLPL